MGKGTAHRRPFTQGGPDLIVALGEGFTDEDRERMRAIFQSKLPAGVRTVFLPEQIFDDPNAEADLWFAPYRATTPDCEKVLEYLRGGTPGGIFEQDQRTGAIYRDGAQVWPSAPIAVACVSRHMHPLGVVELSDWALLFADGERMRITTIPDAWVHPRPVTTRPLRPGEAVPADWLDRAKASLAPR